MQRQGIHIAAWLVLAALVATGCARSEVTGARRYSNDDAVIPRPPVVLVYPFAMSADDVAIDTLGMRDASIDEIDAEGRRVQNQLTLQIVADLNDRGISAQRGTETSDVPANAFLMKGQFITIDEGSRARRMIIGFGAGAERIQTRVQVYRVAARGTVRVAAAEVSAEGDRMPGMAVPVGAGAIAGRAATSAIVAGGMNVVQEVRGGLGRAISNISTEIADRAEAFYRERGWL